MKKALVAGTGISGINSAKLLLSKGYEVTVFDENDKVSAEEIANKITDGGVSAGLSIALGSLTPEIADGAEFCVMSPGINPQQGFAKELRDWGVPTISEMELAFKYEKGRVAAITGTNGKTTTTSLLGAICKTAGKKTFVAGNIGNAYTSEVEKTSFDSISVLEVAGFHLETIVDFRPRVSAILNITPDHLDRFGTMEAYANSKFRIAENQTSDDVLVLNYEDARLREFARNVTPKVLFFSSERELGEGAFLRGERIIIRLDETEYEFGSIHDMLVLGTHNYENVMAAVLMAISLGLDIEDIREGVRTFKAVPHRIEFVDEINGVRYYNDSKGTNPDAASRAVQAMHWPTVLIGGGYDKHIEFDEWIKACIGKVKKLILIGESAKQIAETADKYGLDCYVLADTFEEAFEIAKAEAVPGDAVLLSPACASWDMFKNYEVRGERFIELVRESK